MRSPARGREHEIASGRAAPAVGAHVSAAGGLARAALKAKSIGAEVVQIFPANPRQWEGKPFPEDEVREFGAALGRRGVPLFVHAIYLINLASPDEELRRRSAGALGDALRFGALAGARGVVTHVGSHRGSGVEVGIANVAAAALEAVARAAAEGPPPLLLEVGSGAGQSLGRSCEEMGRLLEAVRRAGLVSRLCLDTAHLFAAGYAIDSPEGLDRYLGDLNRAAGRDAVGLVHLNDSRSGLGSGADRHENVGEGHIGREGLALWLRHPALKGVPFVLEVPGFDGKGPDGKNLRRAKALRGDRSS